VFKGRHFDRSVILLCVRWYLTYGLSLRDLEEMIFKRGIRLDHSTIHRWVVHFTPMLLVAFNLRKRSVTPKWHVDETYIKVRGEWLYLYRAIDKTGATVEFHFSKSRDLTAAKRFIRKALARHGRPAQITIDGSQTNRTAILEGDMEARLKLPAAANDQEPITIRNSKYKNNRIEQDHRPIKRRIGPMLGFKSAACADIILGGIELVHMIRKGQLDPADRRKPSLAHQFESLVA
jgi:transposase-like protein